MANVFISYRRDDSSSDTGRIADRLISHFGADRIFYDIEAIPLGTDFRQFISDRLDKTDVFLAIIGDKWLDLRDSEGKQRIHDPNDLVYIEIAAALARKKIPVIPVLVGKASEPPPAAQLPEGIKKLALRNALILRSDTTFQGQIEKLIEDIEGQIQETAQDIPSSPKPEAKPIQSNEQNAISMAPTAVTAISDSIFGLLLITLLVACIIAFIYFAFFVKEQIATSLLSVAGAFGSSILYMKWNETRKKVQPSGVQNMSTY